MTNAEDICRMDAVSLARRFRRRELSPTEVVDAVLARMERLNPILNAVCTPTPDVARAEARGIEASIMAGEGLARWPGAHNDQGPRVDERHPHRVRMLGVRRFHP